MLTIPHSFKLSSLANMKYFDRVLKVFNRVDFVKGEWKKDVIQQNSNSYDAEAILKVPLYDSWPRDEQFWAYNRPGQFMVCSTYKLVLQS